MKSKACINCGCINWENATNCVRCKFDISQPLTSFNTKPQSKSPSIETSTIQQFNYSDSGFNILKYLKLLGCVGVLLTIGFIYFNYYSYDKTSLISTFDQYYYEVIPPNENDLKNVISLINRRNASHPVRESGEFNTLECPTTTIPNYNCTSVSEPVSKYVQKNVVFTPKLISFEIESYQIEKEASGKIVYFCKYKAVGLGETHDPLTEIVEAPGKPKSVETALNYDGKFSLIWNKISKSWDAPTGK